LTGEGIYVYGVVAASSVPLLDPELETVEEAGLVALCRSVDVADLERRLADEGPGARAWLEETARQHAEVLERALVAGALVPFRLGTIVEGGDAVHELLRSQAADLEAKLARVRGAREWGVKGLVAPGRLARALTGADPSLTELEQEADSGAGRAYFARMQLDRRLDALSQARSQELALRLHERLSETARESVVNPPQAADMILNGAYLVDLEREDDLSAALAELVPEVAPLGGTLELTGPWPAYNFTGPAAPVGVS
jgi:hypothetical protein